MAVTLGGLAAIAGGAAALNSIGSAVFGNINNKRAKSMAALNDRYQRQLLEDVPSLNKNGLQKAGLSVSALNGNAFNSVSSNASAAAPEMTAPQVDIGQLLQMATLPDQKKLLKEQVKGVELDNSKKALENDIASNNLISLIIHWSRFRSSSNNIDIIQKLCILFNTFIIKRLRAIIKCHLTI